MNSRKKGSIGGLFPFQKPRFWVLTACLFALHCASEPDQLPQIDLSKSEPQVAQKIQALIDGVKQSQNSGEAWGKLAMNLDVHDFKNEAVPCYVEAMRLSPEEFRWPYYLAQVYHELDSPETLAAYEKSYALRQDFAPMLVRYARLLLENDRVEEAKQKFQQAAQADPKNAHAHLGLGETSVLENDFAKAKTHLEKALRLNSRFGEAHSLLATVYARKSQKEAAEKHRLRARRLPPVTTLRDQILAELFAEGVSSYWFKTRGQIYMSRRQYGAAVKEFTEALKADGSAEAHHNLGVALKFAGNLKGAEEQFLTAMSLNSGFAEPFLSIGELYLRAGRYDEAEDALQQALALNPDLDQVYYQLGMTYLSTNRHKTAYGVFKDGVERNPGDARCAFRLAWLMATSPLLDYRDSEKAVRLAQQVNLVTGEKSPESLDLLAAAYADAGDFGQAMKTARRAHSIAEKEQKTNFAQSIALRIKSYRKNKAWREAWNLNDGVRP